MKITRESIKLEMTELEYKNMVFCLRTHIEDSHISLLSAKKRGIDAHIEIVAKKFERAISCYESVSGRTYNILEEERRILDRVPSLRSKERF